MLPLTSWSTLLPTDKCQRAHSTHRDHPIQRIVTGGAERSDGGAGCRHYFLLSCVDAFSRYVVNHRLLMELTGRAVAIEL